MRPQAPPTGQAQQQNRDASRTKLADAGVELCPDEREALAAIRAAGQYISPSRLHRMYVRLMADADVHFDFTGYVLSYLDPTGEKATARAMRRVARA